MKFDTPLIKGKWIKRYQRFLADIELEGGEIVTAHCTNSGTMKTAIEEGAEVYLTHNNNPNRKTQYTWDSKLIYFITKSSGFCLESQSLWMIIYWLDNS